MLIAKAIQQGGNLFIGLYIAKILTESDYGIYRLLMAIVSYIPFANLGIAQTIIFKLPDAFRKKSITEIKNVTSVFNSFLVFSRIFLLILFSFLAIFQVKLNQQSLSLEWLLMGIFTLFSGWNLLFINIFRSNNKFKSLSFIRSINSIFYLLVVVFVVEKLQINGVLLALISGALVSFAYGVYLNKEYLTIKFDFKKTIEYIKFGLPIILNTLVWILFSSSILWVVSFFYLPNYTGIFGFALVISTIFKVMPGIIVEMVSPKLISFLGVKKLNNYNKNKFISKGVFSLAMINFVFAIFSLFLFKIILVFFVPKYISTWPMVIFLIIGYYVYNISSFANIQNLKQGKASIVMIWNIVSLCIQLLSAAILIKFNFDFYLIALAPAIGLIISSVGVLITAYSFNNFKADFFQHYIKIIISTLLFIFLIYIFWSYISDFETLMDFIIAFFVGSVLCIFPGLIGVIFLKKYLKLLS
jgi:O-antigen/teichoic acid export membrane protein